MVQHHDLKALCHHSVQQHFFLGIPVPVQQTVNPTKKKRDVNFAVLEKITKCVL